ncbi:hypothetical protein AHiyo1_50950 [Arthrobacter sp. Hiyo1]|uniref:hypothetical protein n=1 Tax=Arthrobacter sp. Hiyo1 TaxID=1588020 RepID=UPI0006A3DCDF|nr:hypothetical protein [Arthrobacter sp. Hiyo1]GAP61395.1 hypothetical protein AHiyo1_50950 [Arthrobacter sp. Hiyo1]
MSESHSTFPPKAVDIYLGSSHLTGEYRDRLSAATTYAEQCKALDFVVEETQDDEDLIHSFSADERQALALGAIAAKQYLARQQEDS